MSDQVENESGFESPDQENVVNAESVQPDVESPHSGGFISYEDIAKELGPFEAPRDFDHGPEFEGEVPRPILNRLKEGSYMSRRKATVRTLLVLGVGCFVFSPFVESISYYILPLAYLHWLGVILVVCGIGAFFRNLGNGGLFEYVKRGQPIVGRILIPAQQAAGNEELPQFRLAAGVEYRHPDNDAQMFATCVTEDQWAAGEVEKFSQDFEAGDYVTLIAYPESVESSLKLYGYLGLDPDREYVLKNDRPLKGVSPSTAVLIALGILGVLGVILMGIHVAIYSIPSGGEPWKFISAIGGGIVAALALWFTLKIVAGSNDDESNATSENKAVGPILASFMGAMAGGFGLCILNAWLDGSDPSYEAIEIVNFWETTHNGIIRTYEIEFRPLGGGGSEKYHATFEDIQRQSGPGLAVMDHAEGAFDLEWTRGIYPIIWVDIEEIEGESITARLRMAEQGALVDMTLTPVIEVSPNEFDLPDEDLAKRALARLPNQLAPGMEILPD